MWPKFGCLHRLDQVVVSRTSLSLGEAVSARKCVRQGNDLVEAQLPMQLCCVLVGQFCACQRKEQEALCS